MNPFAFGVALLAAFTIQVTWAGLFDVRGVTPDFLLLLAMFAAYRAPARAAIVACWAAGLAKDLGSSAHLGTHALLFALAGGGIVLGRSLMYLQHPLVQMGVGFVGALFVNAGYVTGAAMGGAGWAGFEDTGRIFAIAAYTGCFAPFVIGPLDRIRMWVGVEA